MNNIAIFASGSGTNAQAIIEYLRSVNKDSVKLILSNNPEAYVLQRAKKLNIKSEIFTKNQFFNSEYVLQILENENIELIVLAGFLWLIPQNILQRYNKRMINIHPALLPNYGGKGMYGARVHEAVVANSESETGITIHFVNEEYDKGEIILQAKCTIEPTDTPEIVAQKVHALEYEYFPKTIENVLDSIKKEKLF